MHDCPYCYQSCDCDGEDTWSFLASHYCTHLDEDPDCLGVASGDLDDDEEWQD